MSAAGNSRVPHKTYPVHPEITLDSLDRNSSLYIMLQMIGRRKDVLDVGCATGYFAKLLCENDCNVAGLDCNAEATEAAKNSCSRVFVADLDFTDLATAVAGSTYDVIAFGDVLEHLRDPQSVLDQARALLRADGFIVASIPNVAHGAIRLSLLGGNFDYRQLGILDDSHLRFFTFKTVTELFIASGYDIVGIERTKLPLFSESNVVPPIRQEDFTPEMIAEVQRDPESDTLQFVVHAVPLSDQDKTINVTRHFINANTLLSDAEHRLAKIADIQQHSRAPEDDLLRERDDLARRLTEAQAEVSRLADSIAGHQSAADERTRELNEIVQSNARMTAELEQVRSQLIAERDDLSRRLTEAQADVSRLADSIAGHQSAADERTRELNETLQSNARLNAEFAQVNGELESARAASSAATETLHGLGATIDALTNQVSRSESEIETLQSLLSEARSTLEARDAEIQDLRLAELKVAELSGQLDASIKREAELRASIDLLQARAIKGAQMRAKIEQAAVSARSEANELRGRIAQLETEATSQAAALARAEAEIAALQEEAARIAGDRNATVDDLGRALETTTQALYASREETARLSAEVSVLRVRATARNTNHSEADYKNSAERIADLQRRLIEFENRNAEIARALERAQVEALGGDEYVKRLSTVIEEMRKSKFWRLRNRWFSIKRLFGIVTDIP